jgi:hypothetical protein
MIVQHSVPRGCTLFSPDPKGLVDLHQRAILFTDVQGSGSTLRVGVPRYTPPWRQPADWLEISYEGRDELGRSHQFRVSLPSSSLVFKHYSEVGGEPYTIIGDERIPTVRVDGMQYLIYPDLYEINCLKADETVIFVPHSARVQLEAGMEEMISRSPLLATHLGDLLNPSSEGSGTRYLAPVWVAHCLVTQLWYDV